MNKLIGAAIFGSVVCAVPALAQSPAATPPEKCRVAELNPVTNHALCIDPIGASLDTAQKPCRGMQTTGRWTMSNGCDTAPAANPPAK